jgi:hypothetical protein
MEAAASKLAARTTSIVRAAVNPKKAPVPVPLTTQMLRE